MNENPRIVVANLSETFVRLNWTQAQDLLADTLKVNEQQSSITIDHAHLRVHL